MVLEPNYSDQPVLARLASLERRYRRMNWMWSSVVLLGGATLIMGQTEIPQTVTARSFVVVDSEGEVRAEISTAGGSPLVVLRDLKGRRRVELAVADTIPNLALFDTSGSTAAVLSAGPGAPTLALRNGAAGGAVIAQGNGPSIGLIDGEQRVRAIFGSTQLVTERTGTAQNLAPSSLVLFDREGRIVTKLP